MAAIVFDFDGTLVDSAPDIAASANRMLSDFGQPPLPVAQIASFVGRGIPHLVRRVIDTCGLDAAMHARMTEALLIHYTAQPAELTRPYAGATDALTALRAQGHSLGICTNKHHALSVQILEALNLARFFDVVVGGDTLSERKPDPAPLRLAFKSLPDSQRLYIGDSEIDAQTAEAAGVTFGIFTQGYRQTPVDQLPHAFSFNRYSDLVSLVTGADHA